MNRPANLEELRNLVQLGQGEIAEPQLKDLLAADPNSKEIRVLLGILLSRRGELEEASVHLEQVLSIEPNDLEAMTWLASTRKKQGHPEFAIPLLETVIQAQPQNPEILNLLGLCQLAIGRAKDAERSFRNLLVLQPNSAPAHANLGMALRLQNIGDEALSCFRRALELDPNQPQNHLQVFKQHLQLSRPKEALGVLERGLQLHPHSYTLKEAWAIALGRLGNRHDAERAFKELAGYPKGALAYATWLQEEGRFEDSIPVLNQALTQNPRSGATLRLLAETRIPPEARPSYLNLANALLNDPGLPNADRMHIAYALGKLRDQDGKYEEAIVAFDIANQLAHRTYPAPQAFDPSWIRHEVDLIADRFPEKFFQSRHSGGNLSDKPIFIVGMIRSGTTLLDQIISSHPNVISVGEPEFWNAKSRSLHLKWASVDPTNADLDQLAEEYLQAVSDPKCAKFVDKMPLNYRNLGWIHAVFPFAKIIHLKRDPFDTCLSIYMTFFAGGPSFAYSQENIVTFYKAYLRLIEHWRKTLPPQVFVEIDYESIVSNPEHTTRQTLEFLDLPWDSRCLQPEMNPNQITTPSRWQARQPIYRTSIGKRERYGPFLGALKQL